ncbi:MAG: type IX secretion system protein PorQ [Rhodothermales bacterium]|nr:type IX secretion system protein PorQ [Rhodothermales bacterium]
MNPRLGFLLVLMAFAAPVAAQPIDATVFSVVTLDPAARGSALGGATSALPSRDVISMLENPAHLAPGMHNQVGVSLLNHASSLKTGAVAFGRSYDSLGTFGVSMRFLGWGDLTRANAAGEELGTFSAGEFVMTVAGSRPLSEKARYGASLNWLRSGIDGQAASALALDAGVFRYDADQRLGLSASVHNLGVVLSSIGESSDQLPLDLRLGISKRLKYLPLLVSVTAWDLTDFGDDSGTATVLDNIFYHLRLGGEFQFSDNFQVRFGYDHRRHAALKIKSRLDLAGVSFGTGIRAKGVSFDYGFNSWSSLGGLHRITVSTGL